MLVQCIERTIGYPAHGYWRLDQNLPRLLDAAESLHGSKRFEADPAHVWMRRPLIRLFQTR